VADPTFVLGFALLAIVAGLSAFFALRHRLSFRLAVRNVRRGRGRTVLLVLGLLVGTTIVTGSLVVGDTVNAVNVHFVYQAYGHIDEGVYNVSGLGGYVPFPVGVADGLSARLSGDAQIAGIVPMVVSGASLYDRATGIPQSNLNLQGANTTASGPLGHFVALNGTALAGPGPGAVYVDSQAASDVNASVGDPVVVYGASSARFVIAAIVQDDTRGGYLYGGNVFVDLAGAQTLEGYSPGSINFVAVANSGTVEGAVGPSNEVAARLNATLAAIGAPAGLAAHPILAQNLVQAENSGSQLSTLFLVLGLFSIIAGAMLIVGIFVMLAEERKGEMGTIRAIGVRRGDLVYAYYFEGLLYAAGAALLGTFLGLAVAYLMTYAFSVYLDVGSGVAPVILASFTARPQSLLIGYVVGFLLTLVTITVTSLRVSRLNVVRALRSLPEPAPPLRVYTGFALVGAALLVLGLLLFEATRAGSGDISLPLVGGALFLGGAMLVASRFVRNRIAFSLGGVGLLLWGGVEPLHRALLGSSHTGGIFGIFVEGIVLVVGAILLYSFNSDVVVALVSRLVGRRPGAVPVARIGLSYPRRRPFRTAMTLTIFALVLFTIVAVAAFGNSLSSNIGNLVASESGGYTFVGYSQNPIPDLPGAVAQNASLAPEFSNVVALDSGNAAYSWPGATGQWVDGVQSAPSRLTGPSSFYDTNRFNFSSTLGGLTTSQVWARVRSDPSVAVIDANYQPGTVNFGPAGHPTIGLGTSVTLTNRTGVHATVEVIGIMSQSFVSGVFVNEAVTRALGFSVPNLFFLTVAPGVSPTHAAQLAKQAFFPYGLVLFDFATILQTSIQNTEAIIGLLEVFVGLGLAVGIAAIGIVALRAVAERRAEIGMLRATGFKRRGILAVFFLEYSYIALLGIAIGTALGIVLIYVATQGNGGLLTFSIPWENIGLIVLVSYALTVAAIAGPALRAANLPPAEAVRYSE
jgi:putative ABC transport system permease protein